MIVVAGENVVDLVPVAGGLLRPELGGGPATVAVAAARLGAPVAMAARLGADVFGSRFRDRLTGAGVDARHLVPSGDPSTLALVSLDGAEARYDFWLSGSADFGWRDGELPELGPGDIAHLGSLAAFLPPGADALERWARRQHRHGTVTLDPNLRPVVMADHTAAVRRLERLVGVADVVKVSEMDLALAYPGTPAEVAARRWLEAGAGTGPRLVILTRGADGLAGLPRAGGEVRVAPPRVDPVDTIGAGDTAMGALLALLAERDVPGVLADLPGALRRMCAAAALACTRPGPQPPTLAETVDLEARAW